MSNPKLERVKKKIQNTCPRVNNVTISTQRGKPDILCNFSIDEYEDNQELMNDYTRVQKILDENGLNVEARAVPPFENTVIEGFLE